MRDFETRRLAARRLTPKEFNRVTYDAVQGAYLTLPQAEQKAVSALADQLMKDLRANGVTSAGIGSALEILAAIGMLLEEQTNR